MRGWEPSTERVPKERWRGSEDFPVSLEGVRGPRKQSPAKRQERRIARSYLFFLPFWPFFGMAELSLGRAHKGAPGRLRSSPVGDVQ